MICQQEELGDGPIRRAPPCALFAAVAHALPFAYQLTGPECPAPELPEQDTRKRAVMEMTAARTLLTIPPAMTLGVTKLIGERGMCLVVLTHSKPSPVRHYQKNQGKQPDFGEQQLLLRGILEIAHGSDYLFLRLLVRPQWQF